MLAVILMSVVLILFWVLIGTITACCLVMPYITGAVTSFVLAHEFPQLKEIIPGHPSLSMISVIAIVELLIFIVINIRQTNAPAIILTSTTMINIIVLAFISDVDVDSINFGIFITIVYLGFMFLLIMTNYGNNVKGRQRSRNILESIIASMMYAASIGMDLLIILGLIWGNYVEWLNNEKLSVTYDDVSLKVSVAIMLIVFMASIVRDARERRKVII